MHQKSEMIRGVSFWWGGYIRGGGATVSAAFNIFVSYSCNINFVFLIIDQSDIYCSVKWQHYILTKVCMTDIVTYIFVFLFFLFVSLKHDMYPYNIINKH